MKYLIAGLGNIGLKYEKTRHNVGFLILDEIVKRHEKTFEEARYGSISKFRLKNKQLCLLKPNTLMNLSGNALRYWMQQEKIPLENVLVVTDDLALNEGTIRLKGKGSDGGHNGLKHINETLNTQKYARLRFGIGADYPKGQQVSFVLSPWSDTELANLQPRIELAAQCAESFVLAGLQKAMNDFNGK